MPKRQSSSLRQMHERFKTTHYYVYVHGIEGHEHLGRCRNRTLRTCGGGGGTRTAATDLVFVPWDRRLFHTLLLLNLPPPPPAAAARVTPGAIHAFFPPSPGVRVEQIVGAEAHEAGHEEDDDEHPSEDLAEHGGSF